MLLRLRTRLSFRMVSTWGRASLIGVAAAALIVLGVLVLTGRTFRDAFGSNFLATVAGVALGVPIAVWLTLKEADEVGKTAKAQEEAQSARRRKEILTVIQLELTENKEALLARRTSGSRGFVIPFLGDEVWAAMSDGGELRWISDPNLLRKIARSYWYIRTVIFLERQWFGITHFAGMRIAGNDPEGRIVTYLGDVDRECAASINEGLAAIAGALLAN